MASFSLWPSPARKQRYLTWLIGERALARAEAGEWVSTLLDAGCTPRLGYPSSVPGKTLELVRALTLVVLGGRDRVVGSAPKAARRARRHIRHTEIEFLPAPGLSYQSHLQGPAQPDLLRASAASASTMTFVGAVERGPTVTGDYLESDPYCSYIPARQQRSPG